MAAWHRSRKADIGLRLSGLFLCGAAYLSLARLIAIAAPHHAIDAIPYGLATVGFLSASLGSALALLGSHLFDEIEIRGKWGESWASMLEAQFAIVEEAGASDPGIQVADGAMRDEAVLYMGWSRPASSRNGEQRRPTFSTALQGMGRQLGGQG